MDAKEDGGFVICPLGRFLATAFAAEFHPWFCRVLWKAEVASERLYGITTEWLLARSTARGPDRPPGPVGVRTVTVSQFIMLCSTVARMLSRLKVGCQLEGDPDKVSASMQILPPVVTWPLRYTMRGDTTRRKKGELG